MRQVLEEIKKLQFKEMGGVPNLRGANLVSRDGEEINCTLHGQLAAVGAGSEREHTGATEQQAAG